MRCEYNKGYPEEYPDCENEAMWSIVATCCGSSLPGCMEHVNEFMGQVGVINGLLDHPTCGAVGTAGFKIDPLT